MRPHRLRITRRQFIVIVALIAMLLAFVIVPLGREISKQTRENEYDRTAQAMSGAIFALESRVPLGVNASVWRCAVRQTMVAHFNVCFAANRRLSSDELYRMRDDLAPQLRGPVSVRTLRWIWDRLGQTDVHAKRLVDRYRPEFEQCFSPDPLADPVEIERLQKENP